MALTILAWLVAIPMLGFATGLRSMSGMAVLCWFVYFDALWVGNDWMAWTGKFWVAVLFTVFALAELVADKMPWIPNRVSPAPLIFRLVMGGLAGAISATSLHGSELEGILLGAIGALLGAILGYNVRKHLVESNGWPDWIVALSEDGITLICAVMALNIING
ncbi:MAG TPA: DUF4126 family protein [Granulicella sp.]